VVMKKIVIAIVFLFLLVNISYAKKYDWTNYKNRGKAYFNARVYSRAIEEYTKALEIAPDDGHQLYGLYLYRGQSYCFEKLYDNAIRDLTTAIEINPYDVAAYAERGNAYAQKGWYAQAVADLSRGLTIKSDDGLSYLYRAQVYYQMKEYKKAWGDLKMARVYGQKIKDTLMQAYERKALRRADKKKQEMDLF
jgi:tetratricopeptide (TPR) repeat protein